MKFNLKYSRWKKGRLWNNFKYQVSTPWNFIKLIELIFKKIFKFSFLDRSDLEWKYRKIQSSHFVLNFSSQSLLKRLSKSFSWIFSNFPQVVFWYLFYIIEFPMSILPHFRFSHLAKISCRRQIEKANICNSIFRFCCRGIFSCLILANVGWSCTKLFPWRIIKRDGSSRSEWDNENR